MVSEKRNKTWENDGVCGVSDVRDNGVIGLVLRDSGDTSSGVHGAMLLVALIHGAETFQF
jgi:hypothetical protein